MEFEGKKKDFYDKCLTDLKSRANYSDSWLPILEQYVFNIMEAAKLMKEIENESVDVEHTNKAGHTNKMSSPKWRMYFELTRSAAALAKDLQLNPSTAPVNPTKTKKKGFDLTPMKVLKQG